MFEALKGFQDIAEFVRALKEYLSLKNKVLFNENSAWTTGSKTIKNLHKYKAFLIYPYDNLSGILCEWDGDYITGAGIVGSVSSAGTVISFEFRLMVSGDVAKITRCQYLGHSHGGGHSGDTAWIRRIVGVEPVIPEALKKYLGGYRKEVAVCCL